MNVLVTGPFGHIGRYALDLLFKRGYRVTAFDVKTSRNVQISKEFEYLIEIIWGDLRNPEDVEKAVENQDVVIHLAAIIPPLSLQNPELAEAVNVGGTTNLVEAIKRRNQKPKLIFTSSVAVYGDRCKNPFINPDDPVSPNPNDDYAKQKIKCEDMIIASNIKWSIFRLTYIVSPEKLEMNPLLFEMPLGTALEICHSRDVGVALAKAASNKDIWGKILHIAGGGKCRTTYKAYLHRMFEIFGLGKSFLPDQAFSQKNSQCGYMSTEESQSLLNYQKHTLEDYYEEVKRQVGWKRVVHSIFRPIMRYYLLKKSPYYQAYIKKNRRIRKDKLKRVLK